MVLESILTPLDAQKRPFSVLVLGGAYASLAVFLSLWIFEEQTSMVMVFLTAMAALPLMMRTLFAEEQMDLSLDKTSLWSRHAPTLMFFMVLFLGMAVAFSVLYVVLPSETSATVFRVQSDTIQNLNQHVTGKVTQTGLVSKIFLNNVKVMIFCIMFSFLYGAGAMFIWAWNASVIGAAAGNFVRTHMARFADTVGFPKVGAYMYASSLSVLRYSIHGVPEIFAYIIGGLAGGILSVAVMNHDLGTGKFEKILLDVSDLVLLSVFVLFVAALLEVFVTPALF